MIWGLSGAQDLGIRELRLHKGLGFKVYGLGFWGFRAEDEVFNSQSVSFRWGLGIRILMTSKIAMRMMRGSSPLPLLNICPTLAHEAPKKPYALNW